MPTEDKRAKHLGVKAAALTRSLHFSLPRILPRRQVFTCHRAHMYTSGPVWQLASVSYPCRIRPATVRRVPPYFSCRAMSLNLSAQSVIVAASEQLSSNMGGETVILNLA